MVNKWIMLFMVCAWREKNAMAVTLNLQRSNVIPVSLPKMENDKNTKSSRLDCALCHDHFSRGHTVKKHTTKWHPTCWN